MTKFFFCLLAVSFSVAAQVKESYSVFTGDGKKISYEKMIHTLAKADVVFFGEPHDNAFAHWLELQVLKDLYALDGQITLGMEMLESDDQLIMDEYLSNLIEEKQLISEAKMWNNYKTDYRPLVEFARERKLPVIATNVPQRYANMVYRKGLQSLDSLSPESKKWIATLPLEVDYSLSSYKEMAEITGQHGGGSVQNLVASQALKDATMAYFISLHHKTGNKFYHINGAYHTKDYQGIVTYLVKLKPDLRIVTIHVTEQPAVEKLESVSLKKADVIFCIVDDMIKSY